MKTCAIHHLKKSFIMTMGFLVCALHQPTMALNLGWLNTADNLDLSSSSQTDTKLTVSSTNSTVVNTVTIGADQTLQINGNVTVGTNLVANASAILAMSGGGAFNVTTNGGTVQVGTYSGSSAYSGALLDMSGLGIFNANLGVAGTFWIGMTSGSSQTLAKYPMVLLASNSTITAGNLYVGHSGGENGLDYLKLGSGSNILNASTITLGDARAFGSIVFNTSAGTVSIRAADTTSRANMNLAMTGSGVSGTSTVDFSGHMADVLLDKLVLGQRSGGSSAAQVSQARYIFDTGTQNINSVTVGILVNGLGGRAGYGVIGNMRLNGGSTVINSGMIIASNAAPNNITNYFGLGTLIVSNTAVVSVSNSSGPAIALAAMAAGAGLVQAATGTVTVAGGTLTLYNDMVHGASSTAGTRGIAVVNLTGGALLMPNSAIVDVDNFTMTNAMLAVGVYSGLPVLVNRGTGILAPGGTNVVGSTIISNSYVQASTATLDIDLVSRLNYDRVTVTGAVTLAGTINVRSLPAATGDFDILASEVSVADTSTLDAGALAAGFKKTLVNDKTVRIYRHRGTFISFL
jgi:hypothetical protein